MINGNGCQSTQRFVKQKESGSLSFIGQQLYHPSFNVICVTEVVRPLCLLTLSRIPDDPAKGVCTRTKLSELGTGVLRLGLESCTGNSNWTGDVQDSDSVLLSKLFKWLTNQLATLRSSKTNLFVIPNRIKTVTTSQIFRVAAPTICNNLPDSLHFLVISVIWNVTCSKGLLNNCLFQPASVS